MLGTGKLVAWVEVNEEGQAVGAFVGESRASTRAPATRPCATVQDARRWVEEEAGRLGLPVVWDDAALR